MKEISQLNILNQIKDKIYLIAGDASPRKFYRYYNKRYLIVYCTKDRKRNLENYCKINDFLNSNKIKAPLTIKKKIKENYIIIEDFGDNLIKKIIQKKKNKFLYFKKIVNELVKLQKIKPNKTLPKYSKKLLIDELNLFYQWYLPEFFSFEKIKKIKKKINSILIKYIKQTLRFNKVFVHRDFHVENLILSKGKICLIDSQDAVIGHPVYDLMSLIDDVRINLKKKDQDKIYKYYVLKSKKIPKEFNFHFHVLSIQRLLKILGIFLRLYRRDKKKKYLKYLTRTWKLVELRLNHKKLKDLNELFNKYFTKDIRKKKWI
tara:strand:+ start:2825 stop:3778 length:954 start_codon:yes stop_codon:yes gene_type:complete